MNQLHEEKMKYTNGHNWEIKIEGKRDYKFENWSKTFTSSPELFFQPKSVDEVKFIVKLAKQNSKRIRIVGNGHSPSDLPCTDDYMVSLKDMNKIIEIDRKNMTIKCEAGVETTVLNKVLEENDLCLNVLGSISDATIAGMLLTAYHGSGLNHKCLTSKLIEMEILTGEGEIVKFRRDVNEQEFRAAAVSLGCFGIVLNLTIQCEKLFCIRQNRQMGEMSDALDKLDDHLNGSDHFKFYWYPHTDKVVIDHQYRCNKDVKKISRSFNYIRDVLLNYHILQFLLWICSFIPPLIVLVNRALVYLFYKPRSDFDISYKIFNFDCLFSQHVMEWAFPIEKTKNVLCELSDWLKENNFYAHAAVEVRFTDADDLMLSPSFGRKSVWINTIMLRPYYTEVPYKAYWDAFEKLARKYNARPHWAKPFDFVDNDMKSIYPEWENFKKIRAKYDAKGIFLNKRLEKLFTSK